MSSPPGLSFLAQRPVTAVLHWLPVTAQDEPASCFKMGACGFLAGHLAPHFLVQQLVWLPEVHSSTGGDLSDSNCGHVDWRRSGVAFAGPADLAFTDVLVGALRNRSALDGVLNNRSSALPARAQMNQTRISHLEFHNLEI